MTPDPTPQPHAFLFYEIEGGATDLYCFEVHWCDTRGWYRTSAPNLVNRTDVDNVIQKALGLNVQWLSWQYTLELPRGSWIKHAWLSGRSA